MLTLFPAPHHKPVPLPAEIQGAVAAHQLEVYLGALKADEELQVFLRTLTPPPTSTPVTTPHSVSRTMWPSSLYPCGGDLPPCYVKMRESGGDYNAQNPSSSASGAWQFLDSTWNGFGGYARAAYAPPDVQDARAREVWAGGAGCSNWSAC
jgi:hypothetical protein